MSQNDETDSPASIAVGQLWDGVSWLKRVVSNRGLTLIALGTAVVVGLVFYLPVGLVFHRAVVTTGGLSFGPIFDIFTDKFYVGAVAEVAKHPLAIDRHADAVIGYLLGIRLEFGQFTVGPVQLPWISIIFPTVQTGLIGFTAYQALLSTIASVLIGLPGAYILARFDFPGRETVRSLTILPFVLPGIMVAIGFFAMFGANGVVNDILELAGIGSIDLMFSLHIVVLAHAFYNAPLVTRVTAAAWETVDVRSVETARSLGASPRRAFWDIIVPQLAPAVLTGALLTFIFTFLTFPIVLALGGLQLATLEVWVYRKVQQVAFTEAAALAIVETSISLILTYVYLGYETRQAKLGAGNPPDRRALLPSISSLIDPRRIAIFAYALVVVVLFVGPLVSMVIESFTLGSEPTVRWYQFLIERQATGTGFQTKPLPAIRNSLVFAVGALVIAVPMGVTIATISKRYRGGWVIEAFAMAPLAVSGVITGIGLLEGLVFGISLPGSHELQLTGPIAVIAAHAVAAYPFVVRNVSPPLSRLGRATVESARALGATRVRALLDIELPLIASGVIAGAAFSIAISIGEFDSTVILAEGSNYYTMPVAVERYLGNRTLGPASAMGTIMLLVTAGAFVVVDRIGGQFEREGEKR